MRGCDNRSLFRKVSIPIPLKYIYHSIIYMKITFHLLNWARTLWSRKIALWYIFVSAASSLQRVILKQHVLPLFLPFNTIKTVFQFTHVCLTYLQGCCRYFYDGKMVLKIYSHTDATICFINLHGFTQSFILTTFPA
jgi:hypothetical protein